MENEVLLTPSLSREYVPVTQKAQLFYLLLEITPTEVVASVQMPLNFSLVLDVSGSMGGRKMRRLKEAVNLVIDSLSPQDFISVITFSTTSKTLFNSRTVADATQAEVLKEQVDKLKARGGTNMGPAMKAGLKEVTKRWAIDRVNRVVLLTDGETTKEEACHKEAAHAAQLSIPMIGLGIGHDWNEDLLLQIADKSGGQADYIADANEVTQYFQNTMQAMQATVVKNGQLTLRLVNGVQARKVWRVVPLISDLGYKPLSERHVTVPLGELEKKGQVLLIELMLSPRQAGTYRIAQAEISYDVPQLNLTQEKVRADIVVNFTNDAKLARQVNPKVMNIAEKITAFKLQTRALQEAEAGNIVGATQKLRSAVTVLLNQGDNELAEAVQQEADKLEQQGELSNEGKKTIKFKSTKTVRLG